MFNKAYRLSIMRFGMGLVFLVGMLDITPVKLTLAAPGDLARVSVASDGTQGNQDSGTSVITPDGRYIAFLSSATNLVTGDSNGKSDVFWHDRQTGETRRVSVSSSGGQANDISGGPSISADGRYVAFYSYATNLVGGDTNGRIDIFLHDIQTSETKRVSLSASGAQGNGNSPYFHMSPEGRYVVFGSTSTNLVSGDTNGNIDVFLRDLQFATTIRVSVDSSGIQGNGHSDFPFISADGRYILYSSYATNLISNDTNAKEDIFMFDIQTETTTRISVDSGGAEANGGSGASSISADGRYVAFVSDATNLVSQDTNGRRDVFLHDRQTGQTTIVTRDLNGLSANGSSFNPIISDDGNFVAFDSNATNLVIDDTNGQSDVFVYDRRMSTTIRVSVNSNNDETSGGRSDSPSVSADGRYITFTSTAINLVSDDTNAAMDVFVRENAVTLSPSIYIVNKIADTNDDVCDEDCSLREALAAVSEGGMIKFASQLSGQVITLNSSLEIDKDLTIDASDLPNSLSLNLRLGNIRVLSGTVKISSLTIQNGYSNGDGGAIWSNGNLKLINSTIRNSHAAGNGGGIYNSGTLTIQNSAIYNNEADLDGGGLYVETSGNLVEIVNSTISENYTHRSGEEVYAQGGTVLTVLNSTIGGRYSALTSNIVTRDQSTVMLVNSVIACWGYGGLYPPEVFADCYDFIQPPSLTNSILGAVGEGYGLLELADNGGLTKTMALVASSPLIDAGDDAACASALVDQVDQRGVPRPFGAHCDIGAYEVEHLTISGNAGVGDAVVKYGYGLYTDADTDGNYTIRVLPGWTGTIIPSKPGYSFTPAKTDYTDIQVDQTNQDYTAAANTYSSPNYSGDTWRVSITNSRGQTDDDSSDPSISADGRYVAFASGAVTLTPEDDPVYIWDIFVRDNQTGEVELVSTHSDGTKFQNNSFFPVISADGRYVAFVSFEWYDTQVVFVHDRHTGLTEALPFRGPPESSARPSISADGRYIAYMQDGILTEGDSNNAYDIFVYDQWTTSLERISLSSDEVQGDGASLFPSLSGDGRYVTFQSSATNLVDGDTNGAEDVFVRDIQTGTTRRISVASSDVQANGGSFSPSISGDGRYVAFHSAATNLVSDDTNGREDVFVHDLQTGETMRVSISSDGVQGNKSSNHAQISANGRYIAFRSAAANLISGDTNGVTDVFVYDRQTGKTKRVSVASNGTQANGATSSSDSPGLSISVDGTYIAFSSDATNLVTGDTNAYRDIFVHNASVLTPVVLSAPANGEPLLHRRPTFDWENVPGTTYYQIVASQSSTFNTVLWKVNTAINTYTLTADLPAGKVIYWRVCAKVGSAWSPWSETRRFKTAKPPSIPVLVSPANKAITRDYTPLLNWNNSTVPSDGAAFDHYQVQVSTNKTFPEPLLIDMNDVTISAYTPTSALTANQRYYWRVRAFNTVGEYSSWSTVWSFSTALLPPGNLTPTGGETVDIRKPIMDWDLVEGASGYTVQISTSSSFSILLVNETVKTDAFTPGKNLPANKKIYWRVRATGTKGPSKWTTAFFRTP